MFNANMRSYSCVFSGQNGKTILHTLNTLAPRLERVTEFEGPLLLANEAEGASARQLKDFLQPGAWAQRHPGGGEAHRVRNQRSQRTVGRTV